MKIGHEVTADERDALSVAVGRRLRIGERLTAKDVAALGLVGVDASPDASPLRGRRVPRRRAKVSDDS